LMRIDIDLFFVCVYENDGNADGDERKQRNKKRRKNKRKKYMRSTMK